MSILEKLSLSTATKKDETNQPSLALRRKMVGILDDQIEGAKAEIASQPFMKQRQKWMPVEGGGKELRTIQSPFRKFWFKGAQGEVLVELRFGNKPVPVAGKPSIIVGELANLPDVLATVREAVLEGELDPARAAASESRKSARRGKTGKPAGNGGGAAAKAMFMRNGK